MKTDPRVDAYIDKAQPFAQPILLKIRQLVHKAHPDMTETIKWGFPCFEYKGMVCSMAAHKQHCSFGFWKASLINDPEKVLHETGSGAMGNLGQIATLKDLPKDKIFLSLVKDAVRLNEEGIALPQKVRAAKAPVEIPDGFLDYLKSSPKAMETFQNFSPSHKREYIEWITDAKTDATKDKRVATMIEWLEEGKSRNWKYMKK